MERGRRLAFDYGDSRIGVAICDPEAIISTPLTVLATKKSDVFDRIKEIISDNQIIKIYVGLPRHLSGDEGMSSQKARDFAQRLHEITEIEIELVDERLSTVSAQGKLRTAGLNAKESREHIDAMAAVEILELGITRDRQN